MRTDEPSPRRSSGFPRRCPTTTCCGTTRLAARAASPPRVRASQAVVPPAVGARTRVIVRQVVPRQGVGTVILADGTPLPVADVWAAQIPIARLAQAVLELAKTVNALLLGAHPSILQLASQPRPTEARMVCRCSANRSGRRPPQKAFADTTSTGPRRGRGTGGG